MTGSSSGPADPLPSAVQRRDAPARRIGIPALFGAVFGALIGGMWRTLTESDRSAEDTTGQLYLAVVVGLPLLPGVPRPVRIATVARQAAPAGLLPVLG
ncbi:hypothetical protein O7606_15005 [Micromonospora sp. WMMD882]|uniref:hypothetical protein n=1 Tax=Micromonospora sp. WMMD882 TaxID=3015151 RepID=UPI00248C7071|nr:hypothetical protein [Micromonospora sp. WMMD882]WBB77591.1 hypothetical protein O7606_15005 [Micromonospora sp. WMMD882]